MAAPGQARATPTPAVFSAECDKSPLPEPPPWAVELPFNRLSQMATLRAFITSYATWTGATAQEFEQFLHAVDEIVTNAIEHGGGSGVLRIWTDRQTMSCEVSDTGAGLRDPLTGHLPPPPARVGGLGLWLARYVGDGGQHPRPTAADHARLALHPRRDSPPGGRRDGAAPCRTRQPGKARVRGWHHPGDLPARRGRSWCER